MITATPGDLVVATDLAGKLVHCPFEGKVAVVGPNFKYHGSAEKEAASRERSRLYRSRAQAARSKRYRTGQPKSSRGAGTAFGHLSHNVKSLSTSGRESAVHGATDERYLVARDGSMFAIGAASKDVEGPCEPRVGSGPGNGRYLAADRSRGQLDVAAG